MRKKKTLKTMSENLYKGVLAKTLNMGAEEVEALLKAEDGELKPDAEAILIGKMEEHVSSIVTPLKEKAKQDRDNQYGRGLKEGAKKYEETLSAYGIEFGENQQSLTEQLDALVKRKAPKDVDITTTKEYLDALEAATKESTSAVEAMRKELESEKERFDKERKMYRYVDQAVEQVKSMNPVGMTKRMVDVFRGELMSFDVDDQESRQLVIADGEHLKNALGHPITWQEKVQELAKDFFVFEKQSGKNGTGASQADYTPPGKDLDGAERSKAVAEARRELRDARASRDSERIKKAEEKAQALL